MTWIKRNLYFLIGALVAFGLLGLAGWFFYSKWGLNNQFLAQLDEQYAKLQGFNQKNPHPGNNKVDNIKAAKEQQQRLREYVHKARAYFQPIPKIPDSAKPTSQDFSSALSRTIEQLLRDSTNASVSLPPPKYNFSFEAQKLRITFAPGSLEPLAVQLGEVKTICDILFAAGINALDGVQRVRVSSDDDTGPPSDYLTDKPLTNDLAVLTPYELTFRCFTPELAAVLSGFASSPHCLLVKTINIELASATPAATPEMQQPVQQPIPMPQPGYPPPRRPTQSSVEPKSLEFGVLGLDFQRSGSHSLGLGEPSGTSDTQRPQRIQLAQAPPSQLPGGATYPPPGTYRRGPAGGEYSRPVPPPDMATPTPATPVPPVAPSGKGGLQTILDERQLKVTMRLEIVKLMPSK